MSSAGNKFISNKEVMPIIHSDVFKDNENKRFALGVYSGKEVLNYENNQTLTAYLQLRANVYVDQTRMLDDNVKRSDGTELDDNDERSTHFVVLENLIGGAAVFACMRLIEKSSLYNDALPVEDFFPEASVFETPAPNKSVEVSRFIVRHEDPSLNLQAKKQLITIGMAHFERNDLGPIYAVVEPEFERSIKMARVSTERIADPKIVPEYNDTNLGIEIDRFAFENRIGKEILDKMFVPVGSYFYWGDVPQAESEKE